ncbi:MAG TPA: hypothetical protein EYQ83_01395 [Acidobacteria bacterium]|jgi:hypothetical protein|nr:hypothetical protein [Acidobacteriota bacterium]
MSGRPVSRNAQASSSDAGLALLEVVISVGLLVTLAAGLVQLFAMSAQSMVRARHRTSALILAVAKVEQIRVAALTQGAVGLVGPAGPQTEYLDPEGRLMGSHVGAVPTGSRYERVWLVDQPPGTFGVVRVQVLVAPIQAGVAVVPDGVVPLDGARVRTLVWSP